MILERPWTTSPRSCLICGRRRGLIGLRDNPGLDKISDFLTIHP